MSINHIVAIRLRLIKGKNDVHLILADTSTLLFYKKLSYTFVPGIVSYYHNHGKKRLQRLLKGPWCQVVVSVLIPRLWGLSPNKVILIDTDDIFKKFLCRLLNPKIYPSLISCSYQKSATQLYKILSWVSFPCKSTRWAKNLRFCGKKVHCSFFDTLSCKKKVSSSFDSYTISN